MYLRYGSYQHAESECTFTITREGLLTENRVQYATRERWDIAGRLQAASQSALTTALTALEAAYETNGRDLGFYTATGVVTTHFMDSSASNGGTKVVQPVSYPDGSGAEYTEHRNYTLAVEAEFPFSGDSALLLWTETLRFWGGGQQVGFLPCLMGAPQKQLLRQMTTFKASQSGRAIGLRAYPIVPAALWTADEHIDVREYSKEVPSDNSGQRIIMWSYQFESIAEMFGNPTAKSIN